MYINKFVNIILIFFLTVAVTDSLNILAVMPHVGKSHQLVFEPLFRQLTLKGHQLTLVTRYPQKNPVPNWRDVSVAPVDLDSTEIFTFNDLTGTRLDKFVCVVLLTAAASESCQQGLSHPNYQNFLKEDNHFDLILIEIFNTPCFMGVVKRFNNAPVIGLASSIWMPWMYQWFGTDSNPSYITNHFLGHSDQMNFLERVENTLIHILSNVWYSVLLNRQGKQFSNQITGINLDDDGDIMSNISLLLINSHFTINVKQAMSPNSIEIGGIHVENQPIKQLPQDLKKFVDESKHGVIYMSLGSTIRGDSFPEDKKQALLKAFSRLPQRVIWKWEGEMQDKPDNVMIYRWAPQRDLLCHPNVKVFITHTGLLGTIESVDCGTPALMLPLFGDQFTNAASMEQNGGGLMLYMSDITEEVVYEKLKKLLSPQFKDNVNELSNRFKDRPLSPMNTALYWIDYVSRNKGAHFMKMASVDMPLYKFYLLDVMAFIFVIILINLYIFYLVVKFIIRKLFKRQEKIKKS